MRQNPGSVLLAAGLLAACSGTAWAGRVVSAAIPFAFTAGDQEFPAATYSFDLSKAGQLSIQSRKLRAVVRAVDLKFTGDVYEQAQRYEILFNRYGDAHFLAQVWFKHFGMEPLKSAGEKAKEDAGNAASVVKLRVKRN